MDFRYLRAFVATAEHGSFSKAADELKIAQSAVSRQIKLLEESIGEELILRSSKQLTLTPKGLKIFNLSCEYIAGVENSLMEDTEKTIRIGIIHGLLENWFHKVLKKFYEKHQNNLYIQVASFEKLQEELAAGHFDIIFTPYNLQSDIMSSRLIFDEARKIVSAYPFDLKDLGKQRWIIYNQEDLLLKQKIKPSHSIIEVNSITSVIRFVKDGLGVAILPQHIIQDADELYIYDLPRHEQSPIYMATLNYSSLPKYIKNLTDEIIASPPQNQ